VKHAFADDSVIPGLVVACGVAIFAAERVADVEATLAAVKGEAGIPASTRLHCREMFGDAQRRGTAWEALGAAGVEALIRAACLRVKPPGEQPLVVVADARGAPPQDTDAVPRPWDDKEIATVMYLAAQQILVGRYGPEGFHLVGDADRTKIPWLDTRRRQAELARGGGRGHLSRGQPTPHRLAGPPRSPSGGRARRAAGPPPRPPGRQPGPDPRCAVVRVHRRSHVRRARTRPRRQCERVWCPRGDSNTRHAV
jgi:hypothetical protein